MKPQEPARAFEPPVRLAPETESADGNPTIADGIWTIVENWRLVAAITTAAVLLSAVYVVLAPPTFRSDVLLQVEDKTKTLPGLDDVQQMFSDKSLAETEIEIIRSRSLIGTVVDQLTLTIVAMPRTLPIFGGAFARSYDGEGVAPALLGFKSYAWGGEHITVTRLEVPEALIDEKLVLTVREGGRYELFGPDGEPLIAGEVGRLASGSLKRGTIALFVKELEARPQTTFRLIKRRRADVIDDLQTDIKISEKGKKTGIISMTLDGKAPRKIAAILDAVALNYVRQNVERKSAEAAASLDFLEQQLPSLKRNLERAEGTLNEYQLKHGTVDLSMETQAILDRAAEIEKSISELELSRAELGQRFTENHPALLAVKDKSQKLRSERSGIESKLRVLPEQEVTSVRLMRDVKVASELYFMLLNKAQELQVVKSGTIGNVRVLDSALLPYEPAAPRKVLVVVLALLLGLGLGVSLAFVKEGMDQALKDPADIETKAGLSIFASVPHSEREVALSRERTPNGVFMLLARADPADLAIESLRSLRTSLQFALADSNSNVISIGGSSPSVGKTFVSANLAYVLATTGSRVLLVDGDLRRGKLHRFFGGKRGPGLSEVLSGQRTVDDVVRKADHESLHVLTTGKLPPNPSELLGTERLGAILADASRRYDFVVIDAPPILAVTDAALVARKSGVNLLVLRSRRHPAREIRAAIAAFANSGVRVSGAVINDVQSSVASRYGRYSYKYHYHYHYKQSDDDA
jgi:tyrosine-protein kinase Etk/Wzc